MYKGKKYSIICIFMVLLISITVGVSSGFVKNTVDDLSNQQQEVVLPPDLIVDQTPEQEEQTEQAPVFSNGFQAINYALDIMENGKGFSSYFTQSVTTMGKTQKITTKRYRSGNINIAEEWYYIDFFVGMNQYKCFYTDGNNMKIKTISNKNNYNFSDLTFKSCAPDNLEQFPASEWTGERNRTLLNSFFLTINSTTSRILYFDKSSDKNNYIIKCQMYGEKVDQTYYKTMEDNGASDVEFKNLTLTFYVNKKTGYFTKIVKEETMNATYAGFENIECKNASTEIFTAMNVDFSEKIQQEYDKNFIY